MNHFLDMNNRNCLMCKKGPTWIMNLNKLFKKYLNTHTQTHTECGQVGKTFVNKPNKKYTKMKSTMHTFLTRQKYDKRFIFGWIFWCMKIHQNAIKLRTLIFCQSINWIQPKIFTFNRKIHTFTTQKWRWRRVLLSKTFSYKEKNDVLS